MKPIGKEQYLQNQKVKSINFSLFIARKIQHRENSSFSRLISKIAIGSVALGIAVVVVSFSIFQGFRQIIAQKLFVHAAHIKADKFSLNNSYEETPIATTAELYHGAKQTPQIAHIQQVAHKWGLLKTQEEVMGALLKGVGADYEATNFEEHLVAGRFVNHLSDKPVNEIVISEKIAKKLLVGVGDTLVMYFIENPPRVRKLGICGIYNTSIDEFDDRIIIGSLPLIQKLNNWGDSLVGGFEIFVPDFAQLDESFAQIEEVSDIDLTVSKITDRYPQFFEWFEMLYQNVIIFLIIILLVAIFNIVAIMLILIMERTRMIGTLKALGATTTQIQKIFFFNGLIIILKGLVIGNAIGLGFGLLQKYFRLIPLDPATYYMDTVPIVFDWYHILQTNVLVIVLIGLVLFIPTLIIARIEPVKAIKFN